MNLVEFSKSVKDELIELKSSFLYRSQDSDTTLRVQFLEIVDEDLSDITKRQLPLLKKNEDPMLTSEGQNSEALRMLLFGKVLDMKSKYPFSYESVIEQRIHQLAGRSILSGNKGFNILIPDALNMIVPAKAAAFLANPLDHKRPLRMISMWESTLKKLKCISDN